MACDEENGKGFTANWTMPRKACDSCKTSAAQLFCRADSAFLCINCDSKVHGANKLASRHERVVICEVCEQAPASFTCKADAAALCVSCDRDIHSANPLARRHERSPVVPFYVSSASAIKSNAVNLLVPDAVKDHDSINGVFEEDEEEEDTCREEAEAASWLLPNPNPKQILVNPSLKSGDYLFSDADPYLDLDYTFQQHQNSAGAGADSVVPVQTKFAPPLMNNSSSENFTDLDFCRSKPSYSYTTQSLSHSVNARSEVSSSSMDVGVVPDGNSSTTVDISNPFGRQMKSGVDLTGPEVPATANQALPGLDREARVLRYREKRKKRKFQKTIRYASRKAYAETRPRIKGRFAKRTEMEPVVDRMYSSTTSLMNDSGYGIVPSF